jgi:hypothetical protein
LVSGPFGDSTTLSILSWESPSTPETIYFFLKGLSEKRFEDAIGLLNALAVKDALVLSGVLEMSRDSPESTRTPYATRESGVHDDFDPEY